MANPHIDQGLFVAVLWLCQSIALVFVFTRLLLQYRISHTWQTEDILVLAGWLLFLATGILWSVIYKQMYQVLGMARGTAALNMFPHMKSAMERSLRGQLAGYLVSYTSLWLVKLSFLAFFRHLGDRYRAQRILWWVVLVFVVLCYAVTLGVQNYSCEMSEVGSFVERCQSAHSIWYERMSLKVSTAMDIASDAALIILSGNVMWRAQINWSKKLALVGVSLLTAFIIVVALVRLLLGSPGGEALNPIWLIIWNAIEISVALKVACLASFWTFHVKSKRSLSNSGGNRFFPRRRDALGTPILLSDRTSEIVKHPQDSDLLR